MAGCRGVTLPPPCGFLRPCELRAAIGRPRSLSGRPILGAMGTFDVRSTWRREEIDDDRASDDAEEIGSFASAQSVTGMRVVERRGELCYGGEEPVRVATGMRDLGEKHRFIRLEVSSEASRSSKIKNGHHAVLAEHPYSLGWSHFAKFKPARVQGNASFDSSAAEAGTLADALAWIDRLECDFWETGHFRTAGFSQLDGRITWNGQRGKHGASQHVLGLCEDADAFHARLMAHPEIAALLDATRRKTIRIGLPGKLVKVSDEVIEESAALMNLAARQALAGPHKDGAKWVENALPVHQKVDHIYRALLNARNRSVFGRRKREAPLTENSGTERVGAREELLTELVDARADRARSRRRR